MHNPFFDVFAAMIKTLPRKQFIAGSKDLLEKMGYEVHHEEVVWDGYIINFPELDRSFVKVLFPRDGVVRLPQLHNFVGKMAGLDVNKGIVITPCVFTMDAMDYAARLGDRIELIDGVRFADLCLKYDIFTG